MKINKISILFFSMFLVFLAGFTKPSLGQLATVVPLAIQKMYNLKNIRFDKLTPGSNQVVQLNESPNGLLIINHQYINAADKVWANQIQDIYTIYRHLNGEKINKQMSSLAGFNKWIVIFSGNFSIGSEYPDQALILIFKTLVGDSKTMDLEIRDQILNSDDNWSNIINIIERNLNRSINIEPSGQSQLSLKHHTLNSDTVLVAKSNENIVIKRFSWKGDHMHITLGAPTDTPIGGSPIHIYSRESSFSPITSFNIQVVKGQEK